MLCKGLGITGRGDEGAQRIFGALSGHVIFQLVTEAACRSAMRGSLVEHMLDVSRQRHVGQKVLLEQPLALIEVEAHEELPRPSQTEIAFRHLGKTKELKGFGGPK